MRRFAPSLFTALALCLGLGQAASAQEESYVRFQNGATGQDAALQTAWARFVHPEKGVEVVLYGVVHIADMDYYRRVQADLDSYDVVLYEGVAPGKEAPTEADKSLGDMQMMMGDLLGLSFQKDGIDYTRKNLVHADMNMDQLKEALGGSTINPMGQVMDAEQLKRMAPMFKMIGQFGKAFMSNNPRMQDQIKLMMGKQMGTADLSKGLGEKMTQVILIERNKVAMEVFDKQLEKTQQGTIAIFYGAAHNPDFQERLEARGFRLAEKRWLSAWKIGAGVPEDSLPIPAPAKPSPEPAPTGPRWF